MEIDWAELTAEATQTRNWGGINWSRWIDLERIRQQKRPYVPGVYRLRHAAYDGLVYIGETGQEKGLDGHRLPALADNVYSEKTSRQLHPEPANEPHTAAPSLVALCERASDNRLEISYATPPKAGHSKWLRRGIEAGLIAIHRLAAGRSPWAFERRPQRGDWGEHAIPLSWKEWQAPLADNWMGLDWTAPSRLGDLNRISVPEYGVYRIWRDNDDELLYIGQGVVVNRLRKHLDTDGADAVFTAAPIAEPNDGTDEKHRRDIEAELIGAHSIALGNPPRRQFNRDPDRKGNGTSTQSRLF